MGSRNLVQMVNSNNSFMKKLRTNAKKYATAYVTAVALSTIAVGLNGCGSAEEESQCCAELNCTSTTYEESYCGFTSPHKSDRCVTNLEGQKECCSCTSYSTKY